MIAAQARADADGNFEWFCRACEGPGICNRRRRSTEVDQHMVLRAADNKDCTMPFNNTTRYDANATYTVFYTTILYGIGLSRTTLYVLHWRVPGISWYGPPHPCIAFLALL